MGWTTKGEEKARTVQKLYVKRNKKQKKGKKQAETIGTRLGWERDKDAAKNA